MDFFCTVPRPHFPGCALIWPGYFDEHILGLFGVHPSSLSKSAGFVFLSRKASLVSISPAILLLRSWHVYFPLSPTLYIITVYRVNLNKLLQIITNKLRWSNKDNNN